MTVRQVSTDQFSQVDFSGTASRCLTEFRTLIDSQPAIDYLLLCDTRATHEILFPRMARGSLLLKGENVLSRLRKRATCSDQKFAGMVVSQIVNKIAVAAPPICDSPAEEEALLDAYRDHSASMMPILIADLDWEPGTSRLRSQWQPLTEILRYELSLKDRGGCPLPSDAQWHIVTTATPEILATLTSISRESRDCPELESAMNWSERLTDYRESAEPFPLQLGILQTDDHHVGIAVWWHDLPRKTLELKYFGIVPEFRRQGWGRRLWKAVLQTGSLHSTEQLRLDVDCRNHAAIEIYESSGANVIDRFRLWKTVDEEAFSTDSTHF